MKKSKIEVKGNELFTKLTTEDMKNLKGGNRNVAGDLLGTVF